MISGSGGDSGAGIDDAAMTRGHKGAGDDEARSSIPDDADFEF